VASNLATSLPFAPGTSIWTIAVVSAGYGILAAIFMSGALFWAHRLAGRLGADLNRRTLRAGQLPGFGAFSAVVLILPVLLFLPLVWAFHLRGLSVVFVPLAFGVMCLTQGYPLAVRGTMELVLQAREEALRAKLAPHFIFNTLNTLHAQIEQDPRAAQATTERLAQLFRQVIAAADQPLIPLQQELAFVEAYLAIEQARLGERLRVSVDIPEELESAEVPPLSLQVLVENAVKHGVVPLEQGGEVRVGAERRNGFLHLWVEDPGSGLSSQQGTGTALNTLRQRLEKPEDLEMGMMDGRHRVGFRWRQA
jgi:two-component sensor histidine kinase